MPETRPYTVRLRTVLLLVLASVVGLTAALASEGSFKDPENAEEAAKKAGPAHTPPKRKHLPSPVLFPDQYIPLAFDHKVHVDKAGVECTFCHDSAEGSVVSSDNLLPVGAEGEEICLGCHLAGEPGDEDMPSGTCETCHRGYQPQFPAGGDPTETTSAINMPPLIILPKPHIKMNHKVHVDKGIKCVTCHNEVPGVQVATRDNGLPLMGTCLTCHTGDEAPLNCATCHETERNGKVRTDYGAQGEIRPSGRYFGDAHDTAFLKDHAAIGRAREEYCANCHTKNFCQDCHTGALRPGRVHPANWILIHPVRTRGNDLACQSCHRLQTFCTSCHERSGVVMSGQAASFPSESLKFHPMGWNNQPGTVRAPQHHSFQAQRNLRACVACHSENDCTQCHATLGQQGLGVNPHPINFKSNCRTRMRANPNTCTRGCHTANDPVLDLCR